MKNDVTFEGFIAATIKVPQPIRILDACYSFINSLSAYYMNSSGFFYLALCNYY